MSERANSVELATLCVSSAGEASSKVGAMLVDFGSARSLEMLAQATARYCIREECANVTRARSLAVKVLLHKKQQTNLSVGQRLIE